MDRFRLFTHTLFLFSRRYTLLCIVLISILFYAFAFTGNPPGDNRAGVSAEQRLFADTTVIDTAKILQSLPFPMPDDTAHTVSLSADSTKQDSVVADTVAPKRKSIGRMVTQIDSALTDSAALQDSTEWVVYLDSTARMQQFSYTRRDLPAAEMFPRKNYSLFLDVKSPAFKREVEIDSTGTYVTVREQVNDVDVKLPTSMTLDEYIKDRLEFEKKNTWRSFVDEYQLKEQGDELANLFGALTNIQIPIPSNPLLSIFGGSGINLHITGAVDIHGAYRRTSSDQVQVSTYDQVRDEPDFNQEVQINVNGTIGDKLNILADWNTQRTFEYENQLKIKYTGYEDEIIQSVEAGNVSLQTPSFIGGGQALFGIKAKFQTGPLTLTALLSQKKGQTKELALTGGSSQSDITIKPEGYATSHFFVDTLYRKFYETLKSSTVPTISSAIVENRIKEIEVWISRSGNQPNPTERQVNAFIDLPGLLPGETYDAQYDTIQNQVDGKNLSWRFVKLEQNQFKFNPDAGIITLNTNVSDDQALAVAYRIDGSTTAANDDKSFGQLGLVDTAGGKPLILKLVKPRNLLPYMKPAWDLMLKNIYPVGGRDLKEAGFELHVYRTVPGKSEDESLNGKYLLQVLGLDRFNSASEAKPDNTFDFMPGLTVDVDRAEVIFPSLRPFDDGIIKYFQDNNIPLKPEEIDSLTFKDVYDTTKTAAQNNTQRNNYVIRVKASTAQRNSYQLGFNIVEGSVSVLLNGQPLQPNVDYTVDYIVGEVVIRNQNALAPGANVQVKYEQNDLFQLASKTLIGARGEMVLFPNTNFGFTVMNLNQATLSDKVRLGEEPTNNTIFGVDASTTMDLPFLTKALDALPLYKTKEMSSIRFGGEAAYILPDPNTKKSTVASDRGASIAYIDDFEGARRTIPFSVSYSGWHLSSIPGVTLAADSIKTYSKAKLSWYNKLPSDVSVHEIWPFRSVRVGQDQVTVLNLDYNPDRRGMYNFSPNLPADLHINQKKNWAGVMKYISTTGGNIIEQNINYLEIWMKASSEDITDLRKGRLLVNIGRISEDVIPNGKLNSEDLVVNRTPNGVLNPGEDVGLDMKDDNQEQADYGNFLNSPANANDLDVNPGDPSGDDWSYTAGNTDYSKINGMEKNEGSVDGRIPETEDLNGNGDVDLTNSYLEYEVPLDSVYYDSMGVAYKNSYIVGGGVNKWYQFRIPLLQATRVIPTGTAQNELTVLQNVQYIRLWMTGFEKPVSIRIADMNLVGNQWQELVKNDSTFKVSVVNIEDNPGYISPPGVIREVDRTQPDQVVQGNEQSLSFLVKGLRRGDSRQAFKTFARPLDVFSYKSMKMFVHGDPSFDYIGLGQYDAEIFIRFGADTLNYYEYRQPIRPGWDPMNEITINFSQLSSVKAARDSLLKIYRVPVKDGPPDATYGVLGNPSLTQIRYMGIGITHPSRQSRKSFPLSGETWVNELRVVDVDNSSGVAYRFDTQVKLADFGSVGFNYSKSDPNFHGLDQRFGNRVTGINWAMNASFTFDKFFPQDWQGTTIPFGYSHAENIAKPKYLPNTDILVDEAASRASERSVSSSRSTISRDSVVNESQTLHVQDQYTVSNLRIVFPTDAWYIRDTFSKLSYGFTYVSSSDRNPTMLTKTSWLWNFRIGYSINLTNDYFLQPFTSLFSGVFLLDKYKDWKIYFMPITSFNAGLSAQRSRNFEVSRSQTQFPRETRNFGSSKSVGFTYKLSEGGLLNLGGDYSLNIDRQLNQLDNDTSGRGFSTLLRNIFFGGRDNRYAQKFSVTSKPVIPDILDLPKYFDIALGYTVNYNWQNSFQPGDLGKTAGFDNAITFSTNFRLKAFTDPWFRSADEIAQTPGGEGDHRTEEQAPKEEPQKPAAVDTTKTEGSKTPDSKSSKNIFSQLKNVAYLLIKIPLLDYENISFSFTQGNRTANSGVIGSTGFQNFWGRLPFQGSLPQYGPSRLYQLGLISDPSGTLKWAPTSSFPFIGWTVERGLRVKSYKTATGVTVVPNLVDQYSQNNNVTLRTTRPLWEGATLELNWKVAWQYSSSTTVTTDAIGRPTPGPTTTAGSLERSYFSLPPVFLFKVFKSSLEDVGKKYNQLKDQKPPDVALAESFEKGLEALPFMNKFFGQFFPRANWSLRWEGMEKIAGLSNYVERMSLEHSYASSFKRDYRGIPDGGERTDVERVTNGFSPLLGINTTFKELLKGNLSGNIRYNTTTTYDLNLSAANIVETFAQEISLSFTYTRRGFSFPLFGVNLNNDIDLTMTYSRTKNSRKTHNPAELSSNQEGIPLEGNTRTVLEPRVRYALSSRVTAALFYRYTKIAPDEGGSLIPGTSTNEAGLDIHISIQ